MGAGKSVIGKELAKHLCKNFIDLDLEIEKKMGRSICEIFSENGEKAFREAESEMIHDLVTRNEIVAALGGGTFIDAYNREQLMNSGTVIYLKVPFEILLSRIQSSDRPLVDMASQLFEARVKIYELAHLTIEAYNESPEMLAKQIVGKIY